MSMKSGLSAALGVLTFGLVCGSAVGATPATKFGVTTTVQAACLVSAAPTAIGIGTGAVRASAAAVSVTCTSTTPYNVALSAGPAIGETAATGKMTGPASATLNSLMSRASASTQDRGDTAGTQPKIPSANVLPFEGNSNGQMAGRQSAAAGRRPDTMIVTVTF